MANARAVSKTRPWVEGIAGSIGDPVHRLRFLRAVAPVTELRGECRWLSRSLRVLLVLLPAAAGLVSISLVRANVPAPAPRPRRVPAESRLPKARAASDV